ncbi:cation diffusion facilitator family transporter [Ancrocorticia populi]|uniref:cation diffusion facilitator family transporter n=2 Tax=Ancrocorticia populi TaxID=2175228 RepID=UPI0023573262|nr:cation diffusion facilitator family transporter [Ancrocorticia populi]
MAHDHSHVSDGQPGDHRKQLWIALSVSLTIAIAQAIGAITTGSLALLTDTGHAIVDASGLVMALIAATLMLKPANAKRTWGFRRIEVIAALAQALVLLAVGTYAAVEGIQRLFSPPEIPSGPMLLFGIIGLTANVIGILVLAGTRGANLNMRAAFLEVLNDALGSLGVIVAAVVIRTTGFQRADAIAALLIAALIIPRAIKLIRESFAILMDFTPRGLDLDDVKQHILRLNHVEDVHDLHASTIATGLPTLTAHVVISQECFTDGHAQEVIANVKNCVAHHFDVPIQHSTIQIETAQTASEEPEGSKH